jgi:hypothetical protein
MGSFQKDSQFVIIMYLLRYLAHLVVFGVNEHSSLGRNNFVSSAEEGIGFWCDCLV